MRVWEHWNMGTLEHGNIRYLSNQGLGFINNQQSTILACRSFNEGGSNQQFSSLLFKILLE